MELSGLKTALGGITITDFYRLYTSPCWLTRHPWHLMPYCSHHPDWENHVSNTEPVHTQYWHNKLGEQDWQLWWHVHRDSWCCECLWCQISCERALIINNNVVHWFNSILQPCVYLQIQIKIKHRGYTLVNHCAWVCVPIPVSKIRVRWEEAHIVSFATDEDAQSGVVLRVLGIDAFEGFEYLGQFFFEHFVILALHIVHFRSAAEFRLGGRGHITSDIPSRKMIMHLGRTFECLQNACSHSIIISASSTIPCDKLILVLNYLLIRKCLLLACSSEDARSSGIVWNPCPCWWWRPQSMVFWVCYLAQDV